VEVTLDGVVVHLDAPVCQKQAQSVPVFGDVFARLAQGGFAGGAGAVADSHVLNAAINGVDRSCLAARRAPAFRPRMSFSICYANKRLKVPPT